MDFESDTWGKSCPVDKDLSLTTHVPGGDLEST